MNEIERKFLVTVDAQVILDMTGLSTRNDGLVEYDPLWGTWFDSNTITQHYLKNTGEWAIRVREYKWIATPGTTASRYVQTMKRRINDRNSWEIEEPITQSAFQSLASKRELTTPGLNKIRHDIDYKGMTWELDIFQNPEYAGLVLAEIELTSEDQVFPIPFWVGKEVTDDKTYRNARLARKLEK